MNMCMISLEKYSQRRIFCFGDSLTAGYSPPYSTKNPFCVDVERILQQSEGCECLVQSLHFLENNLSSILSSNTFHNVLNKVTEVERMPLLIIWMGMKQFETVLDSDDIAESVINIHKAAHQKGIKTLVLGFPPILRDKKSNFSNQLTNDVNEKLKDWIDSEKKSYASSKNLSMIHYAPFPLEIEELQRKEYYASDGYHFTPEGYKYIGEYLASIVQNILNSDIA